MACKHGLNSGLELASSQYTIAPLCNLHTFFSPRRVYLSTAAAPSLCHPSAAAGLPSTKQQHCRAHHHHYPSNNTNSIQPKHRMEAPASTPAAAAALPLSFGVVTEKNVEQLKVLNAAIFPLAYPPRMYKDILAFTDATQLAYHNDVLVGAIACRLEKTAQVCRGGGGGGGGGPAAPVVADAAHALKRDACDGGCCGAPHGCGCVLLYDSPAHAFLRCAAPLCAAAAARRAPRSSTS